MKKKTKLLSLLFMLSGMSANAQLSSNPDKFLGNITTRGQVDYGSEKFYTLWNQITCENETKWASVEGTNDNFRWNDAAYNYAKNHNFPFKFHALVWGSQYPSWIESLTPEERYDEIVEWMDNAKRHYPDLKIIDVVNEAVSGHQQGTKYFAEALGGAGESGFDWIVKAFELAHERWPEAILIYNDFNTFQWNTEQYITLVKAIRNAGAPIDAYGCQSHDLTDCSFTKFQSSMTLLQNSLKMPMYITEYDIGTSDDNRQLQRYKEQIPYMWEADYCAGVTLWGYIYGATWTTDGNSGIIKNGEDRPAMTWLRDYMQTDAAKNAKSPFPGMYKEASVYIKPVYFKAEKGRDAKIIIDAKMQTKTIEKVELYVADNLVSTMTEAPYEAIVNIDKIASTELKAVVTCTDGTTYERYSALQTSNQQAAYKGNVVELPGVIEAENFDTGGASIAFFDTNSAREGTATSYRSDSGPDIDKAGEGYALGCNKKGEWVEYTVNVKEAGMYAITTNYSATRDGASFNLSLATIDGLKTLTDGNISVPSTSSKETYQPLYARTIIPLEAGEQVIRLSITGGADNVLNIDNITFEHINVSSDLDIALVNDDEKYMTNTEAVFTADINGTTEVENVKYYVDGIYRTTVTEAPYAFAFSTPDVGKYTISAYATAKDGSQSAMVSRTISVEPLQGPFKGIKNVPGIIEAEDFDMGGEGLSFHDSDSRDQGNVGYRTDNEGVDVITTADGGYAIGYATTDEWYNYTINVTETGTYNCEIVASAAATGSSLKVGFVVGNDVSYMRAVSIPQTGEGVYTNVKVKTSKSLEEGKHLMRLYVNKGTCSIDKIIFTLEETGIENITVDGQDNNHIYNINGQRVNDNFRGIFIKNGKKYIAK